ncbi:MAG: hypothetical protein ACKVS6_09170 [Planctomycetota bacterium]
MSAIKYKVFVISLLIAAPLASCASRTVFNFQPSPRITGEPICNDSVAILTFEDLRGKKPLNHNLKNLALIPLIPFATSFRDLPERTYFDDSKNLNGFEPVADLARAFATEIEGQGIFKSVHYYDSSPSHDSRTGASSSHGSRYELRGRLFDSHVSEGYLTYGVSAFSMLLHFVAFPEGTLRCTLQFEVELLDRREAKIVWQKKYDLRRTRVTWIYDSHEADHICNMFSSMAAEAVRPSTAEIRAMLALK